jgi:gentisate 1,2-dioxygenase
MIDLDLSSRLGLPYPATTPLMLARYVVLKTANRLSRTLNATGEIYYALAGSGMSSSGSEQVAWVAGDCFCLPGGSETVHLAHTDSLLFLCTNEPELNQGRLSAPAPQRSPVCAALFEHQRIAEELAAVHERTGPQTSAGKSVVFSVDSMQDIMPGAILPSLTAAVNSLEAGAQQRVHQHNAAAITVSIQGEDVYSIIDGQRVNWEPFGVMITPPLAPHSHHNDGSKVMLAFVVQDGGVFYHCRATGFRWLD